MIKVNFLGSKLKIIGLINVNCILRNKFKWNLDLNIEILFQQNAFEILSAKCPLILFRTECVDTQGLNSLKRCCLTSKESPL